MKTLNSIIAFFTIIFFLFGSPVSGQNKIINIGINEAKWTDGFWAERYKTAKEVTFPFMWKYLDGRSSELGISGIGHNNSFRNFKIGAGLVDAPFEGVNWADGDFYKWLESAAWFYANDPNEALDDQMNMVIDIIANAQQEDGYISTQRSVPNEPRWENINHHELYNMGHLLTAGSVHYLATGKTNLLDISKKAANYLYTVFMEPTDKLAHFGFNPSQIMGLVDLYRVTHEKKYLELAVQFVKMRGSISGGSDQNQDKVKFVNETLAVGHAVTATYLYAGVTDIINETSDSLWENSLNHIWNDLHSTKYFITGGISEYHHGLSPRGDHIHEAIGNAFEISNAYCSNESCSHTGNAMWNQRLFQHTGNAKFYDVIERTLYNAFLSGIGLEGKSWFYTNPLRRYGAKGVFQEDDTMGRWHARRGYCCPPQIMRVIARLHTWAYSKSTAALYVNLYGSNTLNTAINNEGMLVLEQVTDYPWEGKIKIKIVESPKSAWSLNLRIPVWEHNASVSVNGEILEKPQAQTYVTIQRKWKAGDVVEMEFSMEVQKIVANPLVEQLWNQIAIQRGPVVYCLESPDLNEGEHVSEMIIPYNAKFEASYKPNLLNGLTVLKTNAIWKKMPDWDKQLYQEMNSQESQEKLIRLIPYYAWANRGISEMTVWLPVSYD